MDKVELSEDIHKLIISGLEKIKDLSTHLRKLIHENSHDSNELDLLRTVLENQDQLHLVKEYPYVVAYEWNIHCYNPDTALRGCLRSHWKTFQLRQNQRLRRYA